METVSDATCLREFQDDGPGGNAGDYRDESDATMNTQMGGVIRILPATAYAHKNLRAKQEWTYEVYAFNRFGNSETASSERSVQSAAASRPSAPGSLLGLQSEPEPLPLTAGDRPLLDRAGRWWSRRHGLRDRGVRHAGPLAQREGP